MDRQRKLILAGASFAVLVLGGVAWAQVRQAAQAAPPIETTLTPSRADAAALAQARQNPLAARLRIALANDRNAAQIFAQTDASAVPVLAPPDPALLQTARLYLGDRHYVLVVRPPGQIVEILGSTRAFQPPPGAPSPLTPQTPQPPAARAQRAAQTPLAVSIAQAEARGLSSVRTERTEYGVDVSFVRFGAVYQVTFVCDDRASLACSDAAAVQFATRLELFGGGR